MLVMSAAAYTGHLTLSSGFAWLATPAALVMLSVAALLEVLAYYIPGVDNVLDTIATPAALIAGTVVSAAVMTDLPPIVKWTTAVIAGGGAAGLTQGLTTLLRAKSTLTTAGLGNHLLATGEIGGALLLALHCTAPGRGGRRTPLLAGRTRRAAAVAPRSAVNRRQQPLMARAPQSRLSRGEGTARAAMRRHSSSALAAGGSLPGARRIAPTGLSMDLSFTGRIDRSPCSTSSSATW